MKHEEYSKTLIELRNADLKLRSQLIKDNQLENVYHPEMEKLHNYNADKLNEIIDKIGYPTIDKVGKEASDAAWLVIQHAIGKPGFMKKCVELLKNSVAKLETDPKKLAYLADRIAVFENKPQLYGTQFDWDESGKLIPDFYDDLDKVNKRRKSIGLNSLEEQTKIIRQQAKTESLLPPKDFKKRKQEMDEWKKVTGWIKQ